MSDRQREGRAEVQFEVRYRTAKEFVSAYSRNISGGGIFVQTRQPLPLNQRVRLRFTLPGIVRPFETNGIVVWSNPISGKSDVLPSGMGIKFLDLDPQSKNLILEYIKANTRAAASGKGP